MNYVYIIKLSFFIDGHLESAFGKFVLWVSIISFLKFTYTYNIVHIIG